MWSEIKRYREASPARKRLLWEALFALALARIAMACVPFRRIAAWMGTTGAETPGTVTPEEERTAEDIGWAVRALGPRVPWDGRCLAQALAASGMLRRRGMEGTVAIGARSGSANGFEAHAWLRVGPKVVTGGDVYQSFQSFTTFARVRS